MEHLRDNYQQEINSILLDGFEKELLDAAFINLLTPNPLRLNNFAYALRELTRHLLHRLAPDDDLKVCSWFQPDETSKTGITRKHRIKFSIQGGLSDYYVTKKLRIEDVEDISNELVGIINELSSYTHVEDKTFNSDDSSVEATAEACLEATLNLVNKVSEIRTDLAEKMLDDIDSALLDRINSESVVELMEISTHQFIEEVIPEKIHVSNIGSRSLSIDVTGTIESTLMYGSNSDRRKGDGAEIHASFPVASSMEIHFKQPLGSQIDLDSFKVDISSWYE
jgi:hypothetical protein